MKNNKIIYKSNYFFLVVFLITFSYLGVCFLSSKNDFFSISQAYAVIYLIVFNAYFKRYIFFEDQFVIDFPFRFFRRKCNYNYEIIKIFEIRLRRAPYSYPKVVLHYGKWYTSEYFFNNNNFEIKQIRSLYPLIEILIAEKVPIMLHMTIEYQKEFEELKSFIVERNGVLHEKTIIE